MAGFPVAGGGLQGAHGEKLAPGELPPNAATLGGDGTVGGSGGSPLTGSLLKANGADGYGRTQVAQRADGGKGVGQRDFLSAVDAGYGAAFDGVTDDTTALTTAQQGSSTLWLPNGTSVVNGINGVRLGASKQTLRGQGMHSTVLKGTNASLVGILQSAASGYAGQIEVSDMTLDCNGIGPAAGAISARGPTIGRLILRRVRFINCPGVMIAGGWASEYIIEDCAADGAGSGQGTFFNATNKDLELVIARRNRLRWLTHGFLIGTTANTGSYQAYADLSDNYIDLGWWLLKAIASGSGGTVTYSATGLTDTAAAFTSTNAPVNGTVRAMTPRQTGTIATSNGLNLVDSSASFVTNAVKRGEIVRSGTSFAVVSYVESNTTLHVEEWLDQTTWQPVQPPAAGGSYTVYGLLLGTITAITSTTLTVGAWFDLWGNQSTPANGTMYEICNQPVYPIQLAGSTDKSQIVHNTVKRGWGDLISTYGNRTSMLDNLVEDGYDTGLSFNGGVGHHAVGNRAHHCGSVGLGVYQMATDWTIGPNTCEDNRWRAYGLPGGQVHIQSGSGNLTGGRAFLSGEAPNANIGLDLDQAISGVKVQDFTAHGHTYADIYVSSLPTAGANQILDCDGTIVYLVGTNGQRLRYSGTGAPALPASPGSIYTRTDGGAGTTLYVKESGNGTAGWVGK